MNERTPINKVTRNDESLTKVTRADIPPSLRWITNIASLLSVFFFSGIVFGWAPLELMLAGEGQYSEFCEKIGTRTDNIEIEKNNDRCPEQIIRLQRIFTVAQFLLNFVSLPVGYFVDRIHKGVYFGITAVVQVAGIIIFALSDSKTFDHFLLGYGLISLSGCMTMIGAFPASFLLKKMQLAILALISCLFDASSVVFFVFHRITLSTGYSREKLFAILGCIGIILYASLVGCWILLERLSWRNVVDQEQTKQSLVESNTNTNNSSNSVADEVNVIQKLPLLKQLTTVEFVLITSLSSIHILRCNYYIMTADDFLNYLGDSQGYYANIFSFVLPSGVVFVPLIEQTIAQFGIMKTLNLVNILGLIFGILLLIPSLKLQIITFIMFTCFRAYLYSAVNSFIALNFGVETMGRIVGFTFTAGAVVSLLQYPAAIYGGKGGWLLSGVMLLGISILPTIQMLSYSRKAVSLISPIEKAPLMSSQTTAEEGFLDRV